MSKLQNMVRWLLPYGMVNSYLRKNYQRRYGFITPFKQYMEGTDKCVLVEDCPYETIVSVQGFGYSGSGAVVDLLREYDSAYVIGHIDAEGSVASQKFQCQEVDILRLAGGLFEVEKYLGTNNVFQNDALLHRVISQITHSDIYQNNYAARPYFYEFFGHICEVMTQLPSRQWYNPYLNHNGATDILFLKDLTIAEYRNLCRKLLNSIFLIIKQSTVSKPILVLDQITCDFEFDTARYRDYIPNLKLIMVYRDPRDVFSFAVKSNVEWIPHYSVDVFVKWYNSMLRHLDVNEHKQYHVVQFENLVTIYDAVVAGVEQYVGLQAASHTKKNTCLDVSHSRENVGIWMQNEQLVESCKWIYKQFESMCYQPYNNGIASSKQNKI